MPFRTLARKRFAPGERKLGGALVEEGYTAAEAGEILRHVKKRDFVPLIAFAARSKPPQKRFRRALIRAVANRLADEIGSRVSAADVEYVLDAYILSDARRLPDVLDDPRVRRAAIRGAVLHLTGQEITGAQANQIAALLRDGGVFKDLAGLTSSLAHTIEKMPSAVVKTVLLSPQLVTGLPAWFLADVKELPREIVRFVQHERDRTGPRSDAEVDLFDHTVRHLYDTVPPVKIMAAWSADMLAKPSVRWAIILYAATHGVTVRPDDIDRVRRALREQQLTPLLRIVVDRARDEADFDQLAKRFF